MLARVAHLEAELEQVNGRYADLQQINERLEAMAGGQEEAGKKIAELQNRLASCQANLKAAEATRDSCMQELKLAVREVNALRKKLAKYTKAEAA